jgi:hypothetical protein
VVKALGAAVPADEVETTWGPCDEWFDGRNARSAPTLEEQAIMQFGKLPFMTTDWRSVPKTEHPGASGVAVWRTVEVGDVRVRMIEYSPGYVADHWCKRGHVLLVLEGELVTELQDGRVVRLTPGMSYQVANDDVPHRSRTEAGANLFVVD